MITIDVKDTFISTIRWENAFEATNIFEANDIMMMAIA